MKVRQLTKRGIVKESLIEDRIEDFLRFAEAKGNTKDTLNSHRYALGDLFLKSNVCWNDFDSVRRRIHKLLIGISDSYYNKRLSAYKLFFSYCIDQGALEENPASEFKYRRPTVQVVNHDENAVRKFMAAIDQTTFAGLRDYTFCLMLLDTGIRPSEALQICPEDFDEEKRLIHVRAEYAKTRKERYLPLSVQLIHAVNKLMGYRPTEWKKSVPILSTYDGNPLPARGMQKRFKNYARVSGVEITPYHLRHLFAIGYVRNGGDAFSLQQIMGHVGLEMTKIYVNLNQQDVALKHAEASPLGNFVRSKRVKNLNKNGS